MSRDLSVGIDIGSHQIKVVATGDTAGNKLPHIYAAGSIESRGVREGYAVDIPEITKQVGIVVDSAADSMQYTVEHADISIGGAGLRSNRAASSITFDSPEHKITAEDIEEVIESAEQRLIEQQRNNCMVLHRFPLAYKVDGNTTLGSPKGMHGQKLSVQTLFITALNQHIHDLVEAVENAGVDVDNVVAGPIAAAEVSLSDADKIAGCVLVNIGSETVSAVVYDNNQPISLVVFSIGSTDITNDIALGLKVSLEKAEQIKHGGVTGSSISEKKLNEIITARLEDVFELISDHLEKINRQGLLPAGIILTGGGAGLPMIEEVARTTLDLPASVSKLKLPKTKAIQTLENSSWSVAYGTATYAQRNRNRGIFSQFNDSKSTVAGWFKQFLP